MNSVIWLVLGGAIGWTASMIMDTNAEQGVILNVVVGLGVSLLGAVVLLAIVRDVRGKNTV